MKVDRDDVPDYLRSNKKRGPWRVLTILGVGSAITWGVIALYAKPIVINIDQLKQAIYIDGKSLGQKSTPQAYAAQEPQLRLPSIPIDPPANRVVHQPANQMQPRASIQWTEGEKARAESSAKNVFNDSNYTPKQPASTYTPPTIHQIAAAPQRSAPPKTKQVSHEHTSKWIKGWNGGTRYLAEWTAINNYIDGTTVCANHRRGSIDYRECRKAAKQHYHEECRMWRTRYESDRQDRSYNLKQRYCSAASSFSPMG